MSLLDRIPREYRGLIDSAARRYSIPRDVFYSLIWHESGGKADAVSPAGATGLTQIMPATAKGYGIDPTQLTDPQVAIDLGARHLREMYDGIEKSTEKRGEEIDQQEAWKRALVAYNGGGKGTDWGVNELPTHDKQGRVIDTTHRYADRILGDARNLAADLGGGVGVGMAPPSAALASPPASGLGPIADQMAGIFNPAVPPLPMPSGQVPEVNAPAGVSQFFQPSNLVPSRPTFVSDPATRTWMSQRGLNPDDPNVVARAMQAGLPLGSQPNPGLGGALLAAAQGFGQGVANQGLGIAGLGANLSNAILGTQIPPVQPMQPTPTMQMHPIAGGVGQLGEGLASLIAGGAALKGLGILKGAGEVGAIGRGAAIGAAFGATQPGAADIEQNLKQGIVNAAQFGALEGVGALTANFGKLGRMAAGAAAMPAIFGNEPVIPGVPLPGAAQQAIFGGAFGALGGKGRGAREAEAAGERISKTTGKPIVKAEQGESPAEQRLQGMLPFGNEPIQTMGGGPGAAILRDQVGYPLPQQRFGQLNLPGMEGISPTRQLELPFEPPPLAPMPGSNLQFGLPFETTPQNRMLPQFGEPATPNWQYWRPQETTAPIASQEPLRGIEPSRQPTLPTPPAEVLRKPPSPLPTTIEAKPAETPSPAPAPRPLAEIKAQQEGLIQEFYRIQGKKGKLSKGDFDRLKELQDQIDALNKEIKSAAPEIPQAVAPAAPAPAAEVAPAQIPFVEESPAPVPAEVITKSLEPPPAALTPAEVSDVTAKTSTQVRPGRLGDSHQQALKRFAGKGGREELAFRTNIITKIIDRAKAAGNRIQIFTDRRRWEGDPNEIPLIAKGNQSYLFVDYQMRLPGDAEPVGVLGITGIREIDASGNTVKYPVGGQPDRASAWWRNDDPRINVGRSAHAARENFLEDPVILETTSGERVVIPANVELRIHMDETGPSLNLTHRDRTEPYAHVYPEDLKALYAKDGTRIWEPQPQRNVAATGGLLPTQQRPRVPRENPPNSFLSTLGPNGEDLSAVQSAFDRPRPAQPPPPPISDVTIPLDGQPNTLTHEGPAGVPSEKLPSTPQGDLIKQAKKLIADIDKLCGGK